MYNGTSKPSILSRYLSRFINEVNYLLENGLIIDNVLFSIKIICIICDIPTRAFIKSITGHQGYYACERCTVKGLYCNNRIIYPSIEAGECSDNSFRKQENSEHHSGLTPLLNIKPAINMLLTFPLDFMHLCCLGVMKKLLESWQTKTVETRMSRISILQLNQLQSLSLISK